MLPVRAAMPVWATFHLIVILQKGILKNTK